MKAKFLMMGILGVVTVVLGSCSEDPKNDFPKSEFEIRQLRLDAKNEDNGITARSSENPASGSVTLQFYTIDPNMVFVDEEGEETNIVLDADGYAVATAATFTKPTDAIIATAGQTVDITFTPGQRVTDATITLLHGGTIQLTSEEPTYKYTLDQFNDGEKVPGLYKMEQDGSIYNYTGAIYLWHYHPINLSVTNKATGETAHTVTYDAWINAMIRTVATTADGSVIYDEDGVPEFVDETLLGVSAGDELTLNFTPAYPGDTLAIALPDGANVVLSAENPTLNWTVGTMESDATISAVLELKQANDVHLTFTGAITLTNSAN